MSGKGTVPLDVLAAGTDLGRRLARLERRMGLHGIETHVGMARDGVIHVGAGMVCRRCPPPEFYTVVATLNPRLAIVEDSRPPVEVSAEDLAQREAAAGYRPLPPRTYASPVAREPEPRTTE
jgi:hypothetical protein